MKAEIVHTYSTHNFQASEHRPNFQSRNVSPTILTSIAIAPAPRKPQTTIAMDPPESGSSSNTPAHAMASPPRLAQQPMAGHGTRQSSMVDGSDTLRGADFDWDHEIQATGMDENVSEWLRSTLAQGTDSGVLPVSASGVQCASPPLAPKLLAAPSALLASAAAAPAAAAPFFPGTLAATATFVLPASSVSSFASLDLRLPPLRAPFCFAAS